MAEYDNEARLKLLEKLRSEVAALTFRELFEGTQDRDLKKKLNQLMTKARIIGVKQDNQE